MRSFPLPMIAAMLVAASPAAAGPVDMANDAVERARPVMMTRPEAALEIGSRLARRVIALPPSRDRMIAMSRARWIQGEASLRMERTADARRAIGQAVALAERAGDAGARADALVSRGSMFHEAGRPADALRDYLEAAGLFRATGRARNHAIALQYLGNLYDEAADYDRAERYLREAGAAYSRDPRMNISLANNMGDLAAERGDAARAAAEYARGVRMARDAGESELEMRVQLNLARSLNDIGRHRQAVAALGAAERIMRERRRPETEEHQTTRALILSRGGAAVQAAAIIDGLHPEREDRTGRGGAVFHDDAYRIYKAAGRPADALRQMEMLSRIRAESTALAISNKAALMSTRFDYAGQELKIARLQANEMSRRYESERTASERRWTMTVAAGIAAYVIVTLLTFGLITLRRSRDRVRTANEELEIANGALGEALEEVRERAEAEHRANMLAEHDTLTGLPNRRHLYERVGEWTRSGEDRRCTAMLLDLDRFKAINDLNGHQTGDAVLLEVAQRLAGIYAGPDSFVVRLGGDEFIMMVMGEHDAEECERIANDTLEAIAAPYEIDGRRHQLGTSIGIARFPEDGDTVEQMIRAADIAMYEAKRSGRSTYRFYDADLDRHLHERTVLQADLRTAAAAGDIEAWFQPIVSLETGEIRAFETLARWRHPEHGMVPPAEFIPMAERTGIIEHITTGILQQACRAARTWPDHICVTVNISPLMLRDAWIAAKVFGILKTERLRPERLVIEITENAVIDDMDFARQAIDAFRAAGIRVALDDFGCGYSSLSTLRELAFDNIKLDASFVRSIGVGDSLKITNAVSGLAEAMGMTSTAEGIESMEAAAMLLELGFHYGQGYLYGQATPAARAFEIAHQGITDRLLQVA